jgi:hypothetical protein
MFISQRILFRGPVTTRHVKLETEIVGIFAYAWFGESIQIWLNFSSLNASAKCPSEPVDKIEFCTGNKHQTESTNIQFLWKIDITFWTSVRPDRTSSVRHVSTESTFQHSFIFITRPEFQHYSAFITIPNVNRPPIVHPTLNKHPDSANFVRIPDPCELLKLFGKYLDTDALLFIRSVKIERTQKTPICPSWHLVVKYSDRRPFVPRPRG